MIESIKIQSLYGRFTYYVKFDKENLTIITGPNGYGKTTILNLISWISKSEFNKINNLEFKEIVVNANNRDYTIHKKGKKLYLNNKLVSNFINKNSIKNKNRNKYYSIFSDIEHTYMEEVFNEVDMNKIICEQYENSLYDRIEKYFNKAKENKSFIESFKETRDIKRDLGKVYFIQEQRLIKGNIKGEKNIINVIENLPEKFKKIINEVSNNYSSVSNNLDSTYPERLFKTNEGISKDDYQKKILEMNEKFDKLKKYDISDMKRLLGDINFNEEFSRALKIYFDDFDEKYKQYEDIIEKLDLFVEIVNNKLKFKSVKVSRVDGIKVLDDSGKKIELEDLSSGEKQEIALFFELIFETEKGTTLLIDEPEISLHVIWQKKFMNDLISVLDKMELKAIVATHSPQIIGTHRDKQIDLGALYNESKRLD